MFYEMYGGCGKCFLHVFLYSLIFALDAAMPFDHAKFFLFGVGWGGVGVVFFIKKYYIIEIYSGITCGSGLNGELYTQRLQKLIFLVLMRGVKTP